MHPDDTYALKNEGEYGKTEMWYVVDCEPGAKLAYGFNRDIDKSEFERRIRDNTLDEVINYVPVSKGDVFFIDAGTLHAIGEGILIAEVQQNSNTTYRVSDYGRLGADGKPRELHIEKALDVTKCKKPDIPYGDIGQVHVNGNNHIRELVVCEKFSAKLLSLNGKHTLSYEDSFVSLVILEGNAAISCNNYTSNITKGDSVFIPAGLEVELNGSADILYSYV
ncbi:MAG: class I mannose-6-phosphate isomerase [Clostridia bacterium]|nr:class I mannose-6-phosphate isomerase [Clostridia bacterium]